MFRGNHYRDWQPIVAIPARNEAERLAGLIDALSGQTWLGGSRRRLPVVIVVNNSDDGSSAVAAKAAASHPNLVLELIDIEFPLAHAHVGAARRVAMQRAWQMIRDPSRAVLLTTDADATPAPTWIEANLHAIEVGADIVGGHIIGDKSEEALLGPKFLHRAAQQARYTELVDRLGALIDPLPYDPWPRHPDHTGASLAVRANVYAAVGGIPALPFREDLAFVGRVRAAGYRLRHSLDVRVKVSARLDGRATGGMADCLKGWIKAEQEGLPHLVEAPRTIAARLQRRRQCRDTTAADRLDFLEDARRARVTSVSSRRPNPLSAAALVELMAPDEPDASSSVPVEAAIGQIERMIAQTSSEIRVA